MTPMGKPCPANENSAGSGPEGREAVDRRRFFQLASLATAAVSGAPAAAQTGAARQRALGDPNWPSLTHYDARRLARIALPLGGIGTGTVSLAGNGSLRDWEVMNRPAKGFTPSSSEVEPFFAIRVEGGGRVETRVVEGPVAPESYEGSHGARAPNVNLPRFRDCEFAAAYPFGRVLLDDEAMPVSVDIKAFNPMAPADPDASGIPLAVLSFEVRNKSAANLRASLCGSLPNFVGISEWTFERDFKGDRIPLGARANRNELRDTGGVRGVLARSEGVDPQAETWGTLALATTAPGPMTRRTAWAAGRWGGGILDFWDDFAADGRLEERERGDEEAPIGSVAVELDLPAGGVGEATFLIAWHFPNRYGWNVDPGKESAENRVGNYYCTQYRDAWDVIAKTAPRLDDLRARTAAFVNAVCSSPLPAEVKEAALFNTSTLRTQTCFRTEDGRLFGWEGCGDQKGCCHGSCTHVWNYEQATAFLYGSLAMTMREVEFAHATDDEGVMSFRVHVPLSQARRFRHVAADGQMGCVMKMYRDWRLSGDDARLRALWPKVRKALEFCWIPGGWDADRDGVMEGVQHNTMDVEYLGPNPQMEFWYLGALRAAEEMARYLGETGFADTCRRLFEQGSRWTDEHLFNGEYYEHQVRPVADPAQVPAYFRVGMGTANLQSPDYQLGSGCLVDQLVGQFLAHVCGLGHLAKRENITATLKAILKYNRRENLHRHFNPLRTFALDGEAALLMAAYPKDRPAKPFPYFGEVMTGFEYTAAVGMIYEGLEREGLMCIGDVRRRYDGAKRSPFDEAECGHHYARAMASWAAVLALTGFDYSGVTKTMRLAARPGSHFWSNGYAWGTCAVEGSRVRLTVLGGTLALERFRLGDRPEKSFPSGHVAPAGATVEFTV